MKRAGLYLMAAFYAAAGVNHFVNPGFYLKVMPPYLPAPELLNWLSGAIEIALALLLLIPRTRRLAAFGIIALLVAIFPVHVYMWQARDGAFADYDRTLLLLRMPFQLVFLAWAWVYARKA